MSERIKLYDPHPGVGGGIQPLPRNMKDLADRLNGKCMTVEEARDIVGKEAEKYNGGKARVSEDHKMIVFEFRENSLRHGYRLLRYVTTKEEHE